MLNIYWCIYIAVGKTEQIIQSINDIESSNVFNYNYQLYWEVNIALQSNYLSEYYYSLSTDFH